jgi:hypothetical protein
MRVVLEPVAEAVFAAAASISASARSAALAVAGEEPTRASATSGRIAAAGSAPFGEPLPTYVVSHARSSRLGAGA